MDGKTLAALRAVVLHESSGADRRAHEDAGRIAELEDRVWFLQCALARVARGGFSGARDLREEAEHACHSAGMDQYTIDVLAGYCEDSDQLYLGPVEVEEQFREVWEATVEDDWRTVGYKHAMRDVQDAFSE